MNATVKVENLKIYAFHGCMKEESIIGSDYIVNISAECVVGSGAFKDEISATIDYVDLARIAKREMLVRSKLLEAVVKRIIDCFFEEISILNKVSVTVSKLNPPINADVEAVSVTLTKQRQEG
jgi:dihydroneopterin aldolase|tara:strand:- start:87 stop:455 length:369 start_codon:yes stop_codon:yes gene_type:complete